MKGIFYFFITVALVLSPSAMVFAQERSVDDTEIGILASILEKIEGLIKELEQKVANVRPSNMVAQVAPGTYLPFGTRVQTTTLVNVYNLGSNCGATGNVCGTIFGTQPAGALGSVTKNINFVHGGNYYSEVMFSSGVNGYVLQSQLKTAVSTKFVVPPYGIPEEASLGAGRVVVKSLPNVIGIIAFKDYSVIPVSPEKLISGVQFPQLYVGPGTGGTIIDGPVYASGYEPSGKFTSLSYSVGPRRLWWKVDFDAGIDGWVPEDWIDNIKGEAFPQGVRVHTKKADNVYDGRKTFDGGGGDVIKGTQPKDAWGIATWGPGKYFGVDCAFVDFDTGVDGCYPIASLGKPLVPVTLDSQKGIVFHKVNLPLSTDPQKVEELAALLNSNEPTMRKLVFVMQEKGKLSDSGVLFAMMGDILVGYSEGSEGVIVGAVKNDNTIVALEKKAGPDGALGVTYTYNDNNIITRTDFSTTIFEQDGRTYILFSKLDSEGQVVTAAVAGPISTNIYKNGLDEWILKTTYGTVSTIDPVTGEVKVLFDDGWIDEIPLPTNPIIVSDPDFDADFYDYAEWDSPPPPPSFPNFGPDRIRPGLEGLKKANAVKSGKPHVLRDLPSASISATLLSVSYGGSTVISWQSVGAKSCTGSWTTTQLSTFGSYRTPALYGNTATTRTYPYSITCTDGKTKSPTKSVNVTAAKEPGQYCASRRGCIPL